MTKGNMAQILAFLQRVYPFFLKDLNEEQAKYIVGLWASMFKDDNEILVHDAVKLYIATDTKGCPPTIGQIKAKMWEIKQLDEIRSRREVEDND